MFWLALIGLGLTIAGGVVAAFGQAGQNANDISKMQNQQQVFDAQQAALQAQLANIQEEKAAAKKVAQINQQQLTIQGVQVARSGEQAAGAQAATAAVGNVGGASVLRQAELIHTQLGEKMSAIAGEQQKQDIGLQQNLAGLDVQTLTTKANLVASNVAEQNNKADIQFLQNYGWLSVLGTALGAAGQATKQAAGIDWTGGAGTSSIATEFKDYGGADPWSWGINQGAMGNFDVKPTTNDQIPVSWTWGGSLG